MMAWHVMGGVWLIVGGVSGYALGEYVWRYLAFIWPMGMVMAVVLGMYDMSRETARQLEWEREFKKIYGGAWAVIGISLLISPVICLCWWLVWKKFTGDENMTTALVTLSCALAVFLPLILKRTGVWAEDKFRCKKERCLQDTSKGTTEK